MGAEKRTHSSGNNGKTFGKKKFKVASGFLDPGTSGVYATCSRRHEKQAMQELGLLFEETMLEMYGSEISEENGGEDNESDGAEVEDSIENQLERELSEIRQKNQKSNAKDKSQKKSETLHFIDLNCECVVFCKTRKPIIPEKFVSNIIHKLADPENLQKRTRYVLKLTPITNSCSATMEQFDILLEKVLAPHFHDGENASKQYKFAVDLTRRNFSTIERMPLITEVVKKVIQDGKYKHEVDLKNYDKLIIVECFKNNIGVSVVDGTYTTKYKKYNVQQIYQAKFDETKNDKETKGVKEID